MVSRHNRRLRVEQLEPRTMLSGLPQQRVVMSENLYMGADPVEVLAASLAGIPALTIPAVAKFWSDVQKNSFIYSMLVGSGLQDAWTKTHPGDPGYTWGNQPDLKNPSSMSYHPLFTEPHRMDLVLHRGPFQATSMKRLGVLNAERTKSGMWPSDHAGVVATLKITQPTATQAAAGFQATSWVAPNSLTSDVASAFTPQLTLQTSSVNSPVQSIAASQLTSFSTLINTLESGAAGMDRLGFEWVSIAAVDVAGQLSSLLQSRSATNSLDLRNIGELERVSNQSSDSLPPLDVSRLR